MALNEFLVGGNRDFGQLTVATMIAYDFELKTFDSDHFFTDKKAALNALVIEWFDTRLKG